MYSYIKPFIAIQRHTWIHNATGRLENPKISEKGTPMPWLYPARTSRQLPGWSKQSRPHPHAKHTHTHKHTRKRTCKHTCMFTIMPQSAAAVIVVIFHHSEHHARQNTRPGKSSSGGHRQAKKAPRPEAPPRRQKPSCRALTVHKWPRPPA